MEQRIKAGEVVPAFYLPDARGQVVSRQQYRGHSNLLIIFLPEMGPASMNYLRALSRDASSWARDETALVIVKASVEDLAPLAGDLTISLLADVEGKVHARYLPDETAGGWFATDRWGELYAQGHVSSASELPPPAELRGWLEFIACECGG
ncbi:MAG: hypothetical protein KatS3mg057_1082 [Herpetosiphonaceae bacterium]|nr:MAG: hypothetical protein KatS3mg057_1082 [Herpetosiphonaceae bacterium]